MNEASRRNRVEDYVFQAAVVATCLFLAVCVIVAVAWVGVTLNLANPPS